MVLAVLVGSCSPQTDDPPALGDSYVLVRSIPLDTVDYVRDAVFDAEQRIWILSASTPFISLIDTSGRVVRSGGVRGRGPTDLLYPFRWVPSATERLAPPEILDIGRHQVISIDAALRPIRATHLRLIGGSMRADMPGLVASLPFAIAAVPGGYLAVAVGRNVSNAKDLASQQVVRVRNGITDTLWENHESISSTASWLRPYPLWASCGTQGLIGVDAAAAHLVRVHADGVVDSTKLPFKATRRAVTMADVRVQVRQGIVNDYHDSGNWTVSDDSVNAAVSRVLTRTTIAAADSLPAFASALCATDGALWLQTFSLSDSPVGAGNGWWKVKAGVATFSTLPPNFRPIAITEGRIVGIATDDNDVARLAFASLRR